MLIKVCGITCPRLAKEIALLGVDYIGLVFHPSSSRYVTNHQAKEICMALQHTDTQPVAVVVEQTAEEINTLCAQMGITHVQLHSPQTHRIANKLQANRRIFAHPADRPANHPEFQDDQDFYLYDSAQPGSGQRFDVSLQPAQPRFFIAGGLTPNNVTQCIRQYHPMGVDVSSGVEDNGKKSLHLIKQFVAEVNNVK